VGGDLTKARVRLRCGFARCQAIKGSDARIEVGFKRNEIGIWVDALGGENLVYEDYDGSLL
jgi:hypothetical protein